MAVAFRSAGTTSEVNTSATASYSYTLTAGDLLLIGFEAGAGSTPTVTSVKWNTTETMTLIGVSNHSTFRNTWLYGLMGATSGTHNVDITLGASANVIVGVPFGYSGVDSGTPWDTAGTGAGTSTTPSVTASGQTGDLVITSAFGSEAYVSLTMSNGTKRDEQVTANVSAIIIDQASAASVTTNGTLGANDVWAWVSVNLNVAATAANAFIPSFASTRKRNRTLRGM